MSELIGFDKDPGLGDYLLEFGFFQDFRVELPRHLLEVLQKQHPEIGIESIELLAAPTCDAGGMRDERSDGVLNVDSLSVKLDLRITLGVASCRFVLDCRLVLKRDGRGSDLSTTSDFFVIAQTAIV